MLATGASLVGNRAQNQWLGETLKREIGMKK